MSAPATSQQQVNPFAQNNQIRDLWVHGGGRNNPTLPPALDMWQALNPVVPAGFTFGSVLTQQLRNVGLIKRLLVRFTATITANAAAGSTLTLTKLGLANMVSNVIFTDLANNQRINCAGWFLTAVASAKRRSVFGAAYTSDTPFGYGDVFQTVQQAPAAIANNSSANVQFMMEIPFAYNDRDLRGAIFGDVTQATMQVAITLNPNFSVASGSDATLAVYQSGNANLATISNVNCQIYQNYLDQGPKTPQGVPILPPLDLGTAYLLNTVSSVTPIANQDNAIPYVNSRQFLSTAFVYDNGGTLNTGSDINTVAITSANLTNIIKVDPFTLAFMSRNILGDDFPAATYYLDHRARPIDTNTFGNMQLIINPSTVNANGVLLLGYEAMGYIGQINQGGAIPSGA